MAADSKLLQGLMAADSTQDEKNVEGLLRGLLKALQAEAIAAPAGMTSALPSEEEPEARTQAN
jgi:hypothetical protein